MSVPAPDPDQNRKRNTHRGHRSTASSRSVAPKRSAASVDDDYQPPLKKARPENRAQNQIDSGATSALAAPSMDYLPVPQGFQNGYSAPPPFGYHGFNPFPFSGGYSVSPPFLHPNSYQLVNHDSFRSGLLSHHHNTPSPIPPRPFPPTSPSQSQPRSQSSTFVPVSRDFKEYCLEFSHLSGQQLSPESIESIGGFKFVAQPPSSYQKRVPNAPGTVNLNGPQTLDDFLVAAGFNEEFWYHLRLHTNNRRESRLGHQIKLADAIAFDEDAFMAIPWDDHDFEELPPLSNSPNPSPTPSPIPPSSPIPTPPKLRGREPKPQNKGKVNTTRYHKKLSQEITIQDLKEYFGVIIVMGLVKLPNQYSYFKVPDNVTTSPLHCPWVFSRMTAWKFYFIHSCVDFDIDWMVKHLKSCTKKAYNPTIALASDETMTPCQSHLNPHHFFVDGKPHPNGILSTSCGDENGVLLSLVPRRRITEDFEALLSRGKSEFNRENFTRCEPSRMKDLILNLFPYDTGSAIVVDRAYGGVDLVEELAREHKYCVAKCQANRPTWLWTYLKRFLTNKKVGDVACARGKFRSGVPFVAFTVIARETKNGTPVFENFLSSYHEPSQISAQPFEGVDEPAAKDGSEAILKRVVWSSGSIGKFYNMHNGHIDRINDNLMECFPLFRIMRWKTRLLYTFLFGMMNNARRFKELHEVCHVKHNDWRETVANHFSPPPSPPSSDHSWELAYSHGNRPRCQLCYSLGDRKQRKTMHRCTACQVPMCKSCFEGSEHFQFISSKHALKASWRPKGFNVETK